MPAGSIRLNRLKEESQQIWDSFHLSSVLFVLNTLDELVFHSSIIWTERGCASIVSFILSVKQRGGSRPPGMDRKCPLGTVKRR